MDRKLSPKEKIELFSRIRGGEDVSYSVPSKYGVSTRNGRNVPKFEIREHIKNLMKKYDVTQTDMAGLLGKTQSTVNRFLSGAQPCPTEDLEVIMWLFADDSCTQHDSSYIFANAKTDIRNHLIRSDASVLVTEKDGMQDVKWGVKVKDLENISPDAAVDELKEAPNQLSVNLTSEMLSSVRKMYRITEPDGTRLFMALIIGFSDFGNFNNQSDSPQV